jgi:hypothetical protein
VGVEQLVAAFDGGVEPVGQSGVTGGAGQQRER